MSKFTDFAINQDVVSFKDQFDSVIADKVSEVLAQKKLEVAQSFFDEPAAEEPAAEVAEEVEQVDEDHADTYERHMSAHISAANRGDWVKAGKHAKNAEASAAKHFKATGKKIVDQGYTGNSPHIIGAGMKEEVTPAEPIHEKHFSSSEVKMAHTIGKEFEKKGVGKSPYAVASGMVKNKPAAAKKAYKTILAKK